MNTLVINNRKEFDNAVWQDETGFTADEYNTWLNATVKTLQKIYNRIDCKDIVDCEDLYILGDVINMLDHVVVDVNDNSTYDGETEDEEGETLFETALNYVRSNIDMDDVRYIRGCVDKHHSCVRAEDCAILTRIYDLMEEYGEDNGLPEGWWLEEMDEEEIFDQL